MTKIKKSLGFTVKNKLHDLPPEENEEESE